MTLEIGTLLAATINVVIVAYWGGRLSARVDALEKRLELVEKALARFVTLAA